MANANSTTPSLPFHRGDSPLDPPAVFAEWRAEGPIRRIAIANGGTAWLVTRYKEMREVLGDPRMSSDITKTGFPSPRPEEPKPSLGNFMQMDPPDHAAMRRTVTRTFMIKNVERLRPRITELTNNLLDAMEEMPRPVDLLTHFARPLPSQVICELFGVPYADRELFLSNSATIGDMRATEAEAYAARTAIAEYLIRLVEEKERHPGDDMFSDLAVNRLRTGELTKEEIGGMGALLVIGGHESTASMIGLGTIVLLQHPEQLQRFLTEPEVRPAAIEELFRYLSIVHVSLRRVATADLEIGGVTVRKGEGLIIPIHSANRDPDAFDAPDEFDISRDARHHLSFGHGIHQCIAQHVGRLELQIALPALFQRFPGLRLAVPFEEIDFREDNVVYSVNELPITW
ncbi:cytochrome P450 [Streptomyces sulfonofaciens]|uniref:Cytochrome P450 n=1 Tax=Streptomyces sulfonofaciens TaxID=68272 RepID=A0A919G894_9ACTN|nr:cytochrome P450 [Streptomyces sulfonofaciens]GHH79609.1 cytochrome P450 [Streptomyces sulfonofaciens]